MNLLDVEKQEMNWLTLGNGLASDFLRLWRAYVHAVDDLVDGDVKGPEALLATLAQSIALYSHPFYLENMLALRQVAITCTNAYADSVRWENVETKWKREFADHYRHIGVEMVLAVACICGGYDHMREASKRLREICYVEHHNVKGESV